MPEVIGDDPSSGTLVVNTRSNNKFVVNIDAGVCVYKAKAQSSAGKCGILKKGEWFEAKADGDAGWFKITSQTYKNRYVKREIANNKYNFSSKADTVSGNVDTEGNVTEATTTTNDATGEEQPTSTDTEGNPTDETSLDDVFQTEMDEAFMEEYTTYISSDAYIAGLNEGLNIDDLRGVLGIPQQFLPRTDVRINKDASSDYKQLGRVYTEKILRYMPLLLITPGIPHFMTGFSDEQRETIGEALITGITDALGIDSMQADSYFGKYYSLKFAYVDYFKYVNAMLRSAALFLGIQNVTVSGKSLGKFNWLYDGSSVNPTKSSGIGRFLGPYVGSIAFYADAGSSISDSFSNSTTQSQLASTLNSLSDTGRELNFLVGNVGSLTGIKLNALTGQEDLENNMTELRKVMNETLKAPNIMSNILNKAQTILAGGRLVFPEIWADSSFGRSYSCNMKLVSPSGDKLSIYLNILVPIYHLLAMALPRQSFQQAYFSPFLLRCYYKGLFNVDMGIMTGLSITKGAEAEWSYDGIPTVAEVSFEIKDLYEGMFMSRAEDEGSLGILSNITELDYIANSCGININDQEVMRTIKLWKLLKLDNAAGDFIYNNIFGNMLQFFNQKMQSMFGFFR